MNIIPLATGAAKPAARRRRAIPAYLAWAALPLVLPACYVVPIGPDGRPYFPADPAAAPQQMSAVGAVAATLPVRLYPANEVAQAAGILNGSVTSLAGGRGRFQFSYLGDLLVGEATRVSNDDRRGVASAYGGRGVYASCDYQMSSRTQGAGICTFSDGGRFQVHIGN
jgi:hypothetical protein